jgi:hypothetical protein
MEVARSKPKGGQAVTAPTTRGLALRAGHIGSGLEHRENHGRQHPKFHHDRNLKIPIRPEASIANLELAFTPGR